MIDRNQQAEKIAEELLVAYGKELVRRQNRVLDQMSLQASCSSVNDSEQRFTKTRRVSVKRMVRRALILAAVLIVIFALAAISSSGVRERMFGYFIEDRDGRTELTFIREGEGRNIPEFILEYIPQGYELIEESIGRTERRLTFENEEKMYIYFITGKSDSFSISLDNKIPKREEVRINDSQGFVFYDRESSVVIWEIGDYTLQLYSYLSRDEAVKIAGSVTLKK